MSFVFDILAFKKVSLCKFDKFKVFLCLNSKISMSSLRWEWLIKPILVSLDQNSLSKPCAWSHDHFHTIAPLNNLAIFVELFALLIFYSRNSIASCCEIIDESKAVKVEFLLDFGTISYWPMGDIHCYGDFVIFYWACHSDHAYSWKGFGRDALKKFFNTGYE